MASDMMLVFNPFLHAAMARMRESALRTTSAQAVAAVYGSKDDLFLPYVDRAGMITATTRAIQAVDTFDLAKENVSRWPRTDFILAEHEVAGRLASQRGIVEMVRRAQSADHASDNAGRVEVIENSSHMIHVDRPDEVAASLWKLIGKK